MSRPQGSQFVCSRKYLCLRICRKQQKKYFTFFQISFVKSKTIFTVVIFTNGNVNVFVSKYIKHCWMSFSLYCFVFLMPFLKNTILSYRLNLTKLFCTFCHLFIHQKHPGSLFFCKNDVNNIWGQFQQTVCAKPWRTLNLKSTTEHFRLYIDSISLASEPIPSITSWCAKSLCVLLV